MSFKLGSSTKPTSTQEWSGPNTLNQQMHVLTLPSGGPWNIVRLGGWFAGKDASAAFKLCLWSAGGQLYRSSGTVTATGHAFALGNCDNYEADITPYPVAGGTQVYVGWSRDPSDSGQWGRTGSGSHKDDTATGSWPQDMTGFQTDSGGDISAYLYYESANTAPNAPTGLSPTGDSIVNSLTPTLSGTFSDPDAGDTLSGVQICVYLDNGTTLKWDSGTLTASGTSFSKVYAGPALTGNTFYKWKARCKDADGLWGPYSALQRFKVNSVPNAPSVSLLQSPTNDVQTLTPTFNMTHSDPDATDTQMLGYHLTVYLSDGVTVKWDTGDVNIAATTTKALLYAGAALSWGTTYKWKARTKDSNGAWGAYTTLQSFTTRATSVPTALDPTGSAVIGSLTPTFTGSRGSANDSLASAEIEVYAADGTTLIWSSGTFTVGVTASAFSKVYGGSALAYSTTYKWRARVTGAVGGTSAWSALQSFITPNSGDVQGTAPLGTGITSLTPTFAFNRTASFNAYQIQLRDGTSVIWDSGTVTHTGTTSKTVVYPGTPALVWNHQYNWRVRVSSDSGSTWGNGYTGYLYFTTDAAGQPTLNPPADAWLGAPDHAWTCDELAGVTNGTSATTSIDTADLQYGYAALAIAVSNLASSSVSHTYKTVARDLSKYGATTDIKVWIKASSLTNVSSIRLRFTFAVSGDYADYTITPGVAGSWEQKTVVKGTPTATNGTVNWANVTRIGIVVNSGAGTVTSTVKVDDVQLDATTPSLDGVTSGGEVLTNFRVIVLAADQVTQIWDSGDTAGSGTSFSIKYAGATLTKGATYYWKARYTKSTGPTGDYSPLQSLVLNADPTTATDRSPVTGEVVTSLTPTITAAFADPDVATQGDAPTAMQVEVRRNSDDVLMHTLWLLSGLVTGANSVTRTAEGSSLSWETEYKWRVRYADSLGQYGPWSSYNVFKPSQPPTVNITSPGATVSSPSFEVIWDFTSSGGKAQQSYRVVVQRASNGVTIYNSGQINSSVHSHVVPSGYLVNNTDYSVILTTTDADGLASDSDTQATTSSWTAPSAILNFSATEDGDASVILLEWDQTNLSASDFSYYQLYRKLTSDDGWTAYATLQSRTDVSYKDYLAGHGSEYQYKITVFKKVPGDVDLESADSDIAVAILDSDVWFVIGADRSAAHSFELPVYDVDVAEPLQQEVFEPLGTTRKTVVRGKVLGEEGTLQLRWLEEERTEAKNRLNWLKNTPGPHILKSPFGDVWQVEFSSPSRKYRGGGGMNTTLMWIEVA